jgi:hypothetical protein
LSIGTDPLKEPAASDPLKEPAIMRLLEPGEEIEHATTAGEALFAVTSRRVAIVENDRTALAIAVDRVRRIQFDIEKARPATLVIVPEEPQSTPQVLPVLPEQYQAVADALVTVGHRLAQVRQPPAIR